jgi:catechol 2,3-dioxygenase-like lactoylglutathione lyase family enzyme
MKITLTSVMVDDQAKAHAFYTGKLGFETRHDIDLGEFRWLTLVSPEGHPDVELLLEPNAHRAAKPFQQALYADGIPVTQFQSQDIHAEHARLTERGVVFKQPPTQQGPVTIAVFDDTCGNYIQLVQPG